jgi:hypothetical protein
MDGHWLLYGFHHVFVAGQWNTQLFLSRLDYDAEGKLKPDA